MWLCCAGSWDAAGTISGRLLRDGAQDPFVRSLLLRLKLTKFEPVLVGDPCFTYLCAVMPLPLERCYGLNVLWL